MSFSERIKLNKQSHWEKRVFDHAVAWLLLQSPCPSSRPITPKGASLGLKGSELELTGSPGGVPVPPLPFGCGTGAAEAAEQFLVTWKRSSFRAPQHIPCLCQLPPLRELPGDTAGSATSVPAGCRQMCQLGNTRNTSGLFARQSQICHFSFFKALFTPAPRTPAARASTIHPSQKTRARQQAKQPCPRAARSEALLLLPG